MKDTIQTILRKHFHAYREETHKEAAREILDLIEPPVPPSAHGNKPMLKTVQDIITAYIASTATPKHDVVIETNEGYVRVASIWENGDKLYIVPATPLKQSHLEGNL